MFALFHTFLYVTLFTINTSVITLQKKEESNSRNSCTSNYISSQYSLQSGLASHFAFGHVITHTHTLSLSLSLSLSHIFPLAFALLHSVTSRLHVTHLGFAPRISAARHASRPLVTLLGRTSHITTLHHTSRLFILPLVFILFLFSTSAFAFPHSVTSRLYVTYLGFTSHVSASRHTPRLRITRLALHFCPSASL